MQESYYAFSELKAEILYPTMRQEMSTPQKK